MKTTWQHRLLGFFCILFVAAGALHAQEPVPEDQNGKINLPPKITLEQFIEIISRDTNTMFVYKKQDLRGELSITSPPNFEVSPEDIFIIFEKLLNVQGLTMVRSNGSNVVEIVLGRDARFHKLPLQFQEAFENAPSTDFVLRFVPMKHADLNRIKTAVTPFSKSATILNYDPMRMLMVIDTQSNVDRLVEIMEALDVPEPEGLRQEITFYKMKNTVAAETQQSLSAIYANIVRNGRKEDVKFFVESRLNTLVIIANTHATAELKELLQMIDVPSPSGAELTIHELRFAAANNLAPLLGQIFAQPNANVQVQKNKNPKGNAGSAATTPPAKIMAFDNLNALIIIADPATTGDILALVKELDVERGDVQLELHRLKFASAKTMAPLLSNIFADQIVAGKGQGQTATKSRVKIIAEPRLNALIIIADAFAVQRILSLVNELDVQEGDAEFSVVELKFAPAQKVATLLNTIFSKPGVAEKGKESTGTQDFLITPDPRLNSIILFANPVQTKRMTDLILRLDVPSEEEESNFKLYKLQHAVAVDMAKLLKEVTGDIVEVAKSESTADGKEKKPANPEDSQNPGKISMSADEATNSLLVFGPSGIFPTLDRIIAQLDVRRVQVFIEALIMEVTLTKSLEFGVDWNVAGPNSNGDSLFSTGFPNSAPLTIETAAEKSAGHNIGIVGGGSIQFQDQTFLSFGAFLRASQQDSEINILATPQLLMLNNQEASINVSRVIPVATNSSVDANGRVTDQIEFRDVGVIVTIRPQVSGDDSIRLEIQQTSSDVSEVAVGNSNAVTTFKRELKTTVISADNAIVVLGGLLNEQTNSTENKIPGLGDIPLLGSLFRDQSDGLNKTNLLMFIRPIIVRSQADLIRVTDQAKTRYKRVNESKKAFRQMLDELQRSGADGDGPNEDN